MPATSKVIRACLLYEFKLGTKAAQAARNICKIFGENTVGDHTAQNWFKKFSSGDETLEDVPRSGRTSIINDEELEALINSDPRQTCLQLARRLNVNEETVRLHLHAIGKVRKCKKWVPHDLTANNKLQR